MEQGTNSDSDRTPVELAGLTRADFVKRAAGAGVGLMAASPLLLRAGTALASEATAASAASGVQAIKPFLGHINPRFSGSGLKWSLGSSQILTGAPRLHSIDMVNGTKLAAQHIKALGGPSINYILQDDGAGSNDPTKGASSMLIFANDHAPAAQTAAAFDEGVLIPVAQKHEILLLDAGAGSGDFPGQAYAWGGRSTWPVDHLPIAAHFTAKSLKAKKVAVINVQEPANLAKPTNDAIKAAAKAFGLQTSTILVAEGATDYSTVITQLRSDNPDCIWSINGEYVDFLKQYRASGLQTPIVLFDIDQATISQAGSTIDGCYGVIDYFNPDSPNNPWAAIFAQSFKKQFNETSSYYAAAFYEDAFALWGLLRHVLASKGNPRSGKQLQAALQANPGPYPSVFGGTNKAVGTLQWDVKSHGLVDRPMFVFQYKNGKYVTKATAVAGGGQYTTV
jgi:ABC-type branched-subunit amino acid transport system substrate-binding protein